MSNAEDTTDAVVDAAGNLVLGRPIQLPEGPVQVTVRTPAGSAKSDLAAIFAAIDARRAGQGFMGSTAEELAAERQELLDEQDERDRAHDAAREKPFFQGS